jgi:hypothetical protein
MEAMCEREVSEWLTEMELAQYCEVVGEHGVDGDMMEDLIAHDNLALLGIEDGLHQAKVRSRWKKLDRTARKRTAEQALIETAVKSTAKRQKREVEATPSRGAAAHEHGGEGAAQGEAAGKEAVGSEEGAAVAAAAVVPAKAFSRSSKHGALVFACEVDPSLQCAVCLDIVPDGPSGLSNHACDHFFCRSCLCSALRARQMCPCCRKPAVANLDEEQDGDQGQVDVESLVSPSRLAASMVDNLLVHCSTGCVETRTDDQASWSSSSWGVDQLGCQAVVKLGALDAHLNVCEFAEVDCPHAALGCSARPQRRHLARHEAEVHSAAPPACLRSAGTPRGRRPSPSSRVTARA